MNIQNNTQDQIQNEQVTRTYVEHRVYLSKDKRYLTLVLPGNIAIRKDWTF